MEQEYVEMLAAGEDGQWKEMLPPMGSGPDIPKLFKSASKARIRRPPEPLALSFSHTCWNRRCHAWRE